MKEFCIAFFGIWFAWGCVFIAYKFTKFCANMFDKERKKIN